MIGIDTNILVRFFAEDDATQFALARAFLEEQLTEQQPGFVSLVTLAETAWVLRSSFGLSSEEVCDIVDLMLRTDVLILQSRSEVERAVEQARDRQGSFSDLLISEVNLSSGCSTTVTFDKKAARLGGFSLLKG